MPGASSPTTDANRRAAASPVGQVEHERGVQRLVDSFRRIPSGQPVRLAKKSSNLFRPREVSNDGLDTSGLTGVVSIDPQARTAEVQGMCTYETLVDATLPHGLMPLVVPQLRTITLGGAVTGLGIESTSFRNGLPHESVLEMDVLTGTGDVVTAVPGGENSMLMEAMPTSYGTLGYSTRLKVELQPIGRTVRTRIVKFTDLAEMTIRMGEIVDSRTWEGVEVDALDGVVFGPNEAYLVVAYFEDVAAPTSDYTGTQIYYRSLQQYEQDCLSAYDYLWRWDTDWFWCSRAFGVQNPAVRRMWPSRLKRSDVYHRILRLENKYRLWNRWQERLGRPRERVVQDIEVTLDRLPEFLHWFIDNVPMRPLWVCPLKLRETDGPGSARSWPLYPLEPGRTYANVGFWGTAPIEPGREDGDVNRLIEAEVDSLGGHKSLYSDVYYDRATFQRLYGADAYAVAKNHYDPSYRFAGLYEKVTNL